MLDSKSRDLLTVYHGHLSPIKYAEGLRVVEASYRRTHRIDKNHPLYASCVAIVQAHGRRIKGQGSPQECDDVFRKITST